MSKFDKTAVYGRENPFIPSPETMDALKDALIEEADERSDMLIGMTTAPDGRKVLRRQSAGRNTGWRSLIGLRYRIQTKEEADELRLDYRRFFEGYVERTDKSERRNLLDLEHKTVDGAYRYTVEGVVADCEETSVSNRVCVPPVSDVSACGEFGWFSDAYRLAYLACHVREEHCYPSRPYRAS